MAKPRLIIVVRHAQSEGNKNRDIHQTIPDHRVKLTPLGWQQAHEAGRQLRALLKPTDTLHFFTSPYRRTRETTEGILETLTGADETSGDPSQWQRENIKVYEEPRLREQDFGNFQPCSAEMERMWQERADYGHFFYRIPNGESAADAYDRVSGFNESLWRQFGEDDFASVCVLVTHGLMSRVFLMKWYHFTVEHFEDLRNINHCEFLLMRKNEESGKYVLENQLRTWSELRRERLEQKQTESQTQANKDAEKLTRSKTFVSLRRWGGCPNGCNHRKEYKRREDLERLRLQDETTATIASHGAGGAAAAKDLQNGANGSNGSNGANGNTNGNSSSTNLTIKSRRSISKRNVQIQEGSTVLSGGPQIDITRALEELDSSPDATPSFISADDRLRSLRSPHLHIGRDGGGTYSGHASPSGSDDEVSGDEDSRRPGSSGLDSLAERIHSTSLASKVRIGRVEVENVDDEPSQHQRVYLDESGMGRGAMANRLGDHSHNNSDVGSDVGTPDTRPSDPLASPLDEDELTRLEREEKSVQGSVY